MEKNNQKKGISKFVISMLVTSIFGIFGIAGLIFGFISYAELKKSNEIIAIQMTESRTSFGIFEKNLTEDVRGLHDMVIALVTETDSTKTQVAEAETTQQVPETETTQKIEDYQRLAFQTRDGIPNNTYTAEINKNQIGVFTSGPVKINNYFLPGGADPDRGSVVVLLPEDGQITTIYTFSELVPSNNWFGIFDVNEINSNNIDILTNDYIGKMRKPPNGTSKNGCKIIDVLILKGKNVYFGPETFQY